MAKYTLHTSFEARARQHRQTIRKRGWGTGAATEAKFSAKLLYPSFWGAWLAILLLRLLVTLLPYKALLALGKMLGLIVVKVLPSRKYIAERNVKLAFPELNEEEQRELTRKICINSGMGILETGMAWFWSDKRILKHAHIDPVELEHARDIAAANRRTLVLTCHFVTLELMARIYALLIKPGVGIYRSSDHPVWEYAQVKGRLRSNLALVDRNDVRSMLKALMQGYPIWYAPDQDYGRRSAIFVPFLGVDKAATVTGTHDLAKVKGTLVQPSWTTRDDKGYCLHVLDPLENFPTEDETADTIRVNQVIEQMIRSAPEQYLWMHRRFKTAPEGEPSRYPDIK